MIVEEGTVEVLVDGKLKRVGPGSVVFNASNQMHSLRRGAGDLSRDQLDIGGDAEQMTTGYFQ